MNNNSLGVVFSGGGSRTLAHVGLIRALEEHHIEATHVSGTSAGAIVAALYAAGYPAGEIFDFFKKTRLFKVSLHALSEPGFQSTDTYSGIFRQYFRHDNFDALQKKLFVAATDILNAKCKIFHEGKLIKVLLAAASFRSRILRLHGLRKPSFRCISGRFAQGISFRLCPRPGAVHQQFRRISGYPLIY